jgi:hypothetical protein
MALKACPHCDGFFNPGAIWNAHEKKCAASFGITSEADKLKRLKARAKKTDTEVLDHSDNTYLLWNRGQWRGWAVGRVTDRDARVTRIDATHFDHDLLWNTSDLMRDVLDGRVFFVDPIVLLRMLSDQCSVMEDGKSPLTEKAAELIEEAAELLALFKRTREIEVQDDLDDTAAQLKAQMAEEKKDR